MKNNVKRKAFKEVVIINPNLVSGTPVFAGTRVPIQILFDHIQNNISVSEFLRDFPTVSKEQAYKLLEVIAETVTSENFLTSEK